MSSHWTMIFSAYTSQIHTVFSLIPTRNEHPRFNGPIKWTYSFAKSNFFTLNPICSPTVGRKITSMHPARIPHSSPSENTNDFHFSRRRSWIFETCHLFFAYSCRPTILHSLSDSGPVFCVNLVLSRRWLVWGICVCALTRELVPYSSFMITLRGTQCLMLLELNYWSNAHLQTCTFKVGLKFCFPGSFRHLFPRGLYGE